MKKGIIFLINGLGIEKQGSYQLSIDQAMRELSVVKETAYFTTAVINSLDMRSAYESFFLGNSIKSEMRYLSTQLSEEALKGNQVYHNFANTLTNPEKKLHIFVEPSSNQVVDQINNLINNLNLDPSKKVFIHLLLTQQTVNEYKKLVDTINYIQYHLNTRISVGFIMGKELFNETLTVEELDYAKKMFFYCSCERWIEVDKKLLSLKENNIRPCQAKGFCATNTCNITEDDTILFFNTKTTSYDKFIESIYQNAPKVFKKNDFSLPCFSIIKLDSKYQIQSFLTNIEYDNSLVKYLEKINKKCLIFSSEENISLINFLANGLHHVNNSHLTFMKNDISYLSNINNITSIIDNTDYELIIFDYHMDVSKTINDLKEQLEQIDKVIGAVAKVCENKHALFITSLYGIKKTLPLAPYNNEEVTINYEMQIPIFLYDYTYPKGKYSLFPGETNDILQTVLHIISNDNSFNNLIKEKNFLNNILSIFIK